MFHISNSFPPVKQLLINSTALFRRGTQQTCARQIFLASEQGLRRKTKLQSSLFQLIARILAAILIPRLKTASPLEPTSPGDPQIRSPAGIPTSPRRRSQGAGKRQLSTRPIKDIAISGTRVTKRSRLFARLACFWDQKSGRGSHGVPGSTRGRVLTWPRAPRPSDEIGGARRTEGFATCLKRLIRRNQIKVVFCPVAVAYRLGWEKREREDRAEEARSDRDAGRKRSLEDWMKGFRRAASKTIFNARATRHGERAYAVHVPTRARKTQLCLLNNILESASARYRGSQGARLLPGRRAPRGVLLCGRNCVN